MPSKEELCVLANSGKVPANTNDFLAQDVEQLVSEIKENLRLTAAAATLKARPSYNNRAKSSRPSPYRVPCRSWSEPSCENCVKSKNVSSTTTVTTSNCMSCAKKHRRPNSADRNDTTSDDPYEMLQELLRDGSLIKEAVRRLQFGLSPKQRYFYDSEEDSRSPVVKMCHVQL